MQKGISKYPLGRVGLALCTIIRAWRLVQASNASYNVTQYLGLEALYNATGGNQWIVSSGWRNATRGFCSWHGVSCDSTGNVSSLVLSRNGLEGNLSVAARLFGRISSLETIDLSNNSLFGPVPTALGEMPRLKLLDLSRNFFSSLPSTWGSGAPSLKHLLLQSNNISGWVPELMGPVGIVGVVVAGTRATRAIKRPTVTRRIRARCSDTRVTAA